MKNQFIHIIAYLIFSLFLFCTPYTAKYKTMTKPDCSEKYFHFLSQEEIDKLSKDPRRSVETIENLFTKVKPEIISFFHGRDSLFNNTDSLDFNITIASNGKLSAFKPSKPQFDTFTINEFKSILEPYYLDSIEERTFGARFHINIQKTSTGLNCIMKKDVDYCQVRSKASIMRIVMSDLAYLRYAYNRRLREKPGLKGRITVKFAIDEHGTVIFSKVFKTTMHDIKLEKAVVKIIKTWEFCPINNKKDVTEVVYPFVFSQ